MKEIPKTIARYLHTQNNFDVDGLVDAFTTDALVFDEGRTYKGAEAIRAWNIETNKKYHTQMRLLELIEVNGIFHLTIEMTGTFPGSPTTAQFAFKILSDKITQLKIT